MRGAWEKRRTREVQERRKFLRSGGSETIFFFVAFTEMKFMAREMLEEIAGR